MLLNHFSYHHPKDLEEAVSLLSSLPDAKLIAGGTFLINNLKALKKKGLKTPAHIISLKKIKELKSIRVDHHSVSIAAMTTIDEIISSKELAKALPILTTVAENIATTQIRNMATIGGNITSRYTWAEFNNCLLALDAKLHFILCDKKTTIVPIDEFLSKNAKCNDILTSISIETKKNTITSYQRLPRSSDVDIPLFAVCLKAEAEDNCLKNVCAVINKGTSFPKREKKLEQVLEGLTLGQTPQKQLDSHSWQIDDEQLEEFQKIILAALTKEAVNDLRTKTK